MHRVGNLGEHLPTRRHLRMCRSKGFLADLKRTTNEPLGFPIVALDGLNHSDRSHRDRRDWMLVPHDPVCQQERLVQQEIRFSILSLRRLQYPYMLQGRWLRQDDLNPGQPHSLPGHIGTQVPLAHACVGWHTKRPVRLSCRQDVD